MRVGPRLVERERDGVHTGLRSGSFAVGRPLCGVRRVVGVFDFATPAYAARRPVSRVAERRRAFDAAVGAEAEDAVRIRERVAAGGVKLRPRPIVVGSFRGPWEMNIS